MKKTTILLFILTLCGTWASAQFSHLNEVKLETSEDYTEYADQILDCSDYILLTPYDKKDSERKAAIDFITRWIQGSPDYSVTINDNIKLITEEKEDLLGLYITCYAKHTLENDVKYSKKEQLENIAINSLIEYCGNPINKIKPTKEMKSMIALKNNGELASISDYFLSKKEAN